MAETIEELEAQLAAAIDAYQQVQLLKTLTEAHKQQGNFETALTYYEQFYTKRQQIESELTQYYEHLEELVEARTAELKKIYEQFQQEIIERKQAEEQFKTALQEKEALIREINHRVRNNLQVISSLFDLQIDYIKDKTCSKVFKENKHRIKSMVFIHEQLHQNRDLPQINFSDYVETLTNYLLRSYKPESGGKVNLLLNVVEVSLSIAQAIPCGLIINELVSNALKHAFPKGQAGTIWVELHRTEEQQLLLRVKDNGAGLLPEIDVRHAETLGLTLVTTLIKQLKGAFELKGEEGTEFNIVFTPKS